MAEILGLGMTHYPGLYRHDSDMVATLRRTLSGKRMPERLKDPANWPAPMREEWGSDEGATAARAPHTLLCRHSHAAPARWTRFAPTRW